MTIATDAFFDPSRTSMHRSLALLATGALLGLAIAGYGLFTAKGTRSGGVPPEAVALVNQRPILRSDFMTQSSAQYAVPFPEVTQEQRAATLKSMIDEELMMQRGLEIDLPGYDPDVRNALVAGVELEVTAEVLAQRPTDAELHAYYDEHRIEYSSEGAMQLRDLVAGDDVTARAALADLRARQPLDGVMQRYGLVDSRRFMANGKVDLDEVYDFAVRAKVGPSLYRTLADLHDGEISEPVKEIDGIHLIVMVKHRMAVAQTFDQAADHVWNDVKKAAALRVSAANLAYLHGRADILVAPDYAR